MQLPAETWPRLAICVPLIIQVISKTVRKRKYTISKTIIWAQSWICVEIKDFDLYIFEIIPEIMDLDVQIIDVDGIPNHGFGVQIIDLEFQIKGLDLQIYDFLNNLKNLEVQIR